MWVGEKFQSNPEIAGSPRNSFRASLVPRGVRTLPKTIKLRMPCWRCTGVRLREISFVVKRETAQICS